MINLLYPNASAAPPEARYPGVPWTIDGQLMRDRRSAFIGTQPPAKPATNAAQRFPFSTIIAGIGIAFALIVLGFIFPGQFIPRDERVAVEASPAPAVVHGEPL